MCNRRGAYFVMRLKIFLSVLIFLLFVMALPSCAWSHFAARQEAAQDISNGTLKVYVGGGIIGGQLLGIAKEDWPLVKDLPRAGDDQGCSDPEGPEKRSYYADYNKAIIRYLKNKSP